MRKHRDAYWEQLKYEMSVIGSKPEYVDYFLIVSEAIRWAKDNDIPVGPGRGSSAASVVCWLLRITEVDPLAFPTLVFERFLTEDRVDLPDIDVDLADNRREEVRQHLVEKYGPDKVGNIANFVRYAGKNAINDVARVYSIPAYEAATINDLVIERSGGDSRSEATLEDTFDMFPAAQAVLDRWPQFHRAIELEGNMRGMSVHAAGLVVSSEPITNICAMYERDGRNVIAYDKKDAEYLGMLKLDFLGLSTMGMIAIALDLAGLTLEDLYAIPLDDETTVAGFRRGDVIGVFQFEGRATRLVNRDVAPDNFMELADVNALSRPGPLFSGTTANYCDVKHERADPIRLHPVVDKITDWTSGQVIYQEQILQICREFGNFPYTHAAHIRKIISQKKGEAAFHASWEHFRDGAQELHGVGEEVAWDVWKFMLTSASY